MLPAAAFTGAGNLQNSDLRACSEVAAGPATGCRGDDDAVGGVGEHGVGGRLPG